MRRTIGLGVVAAGVVLLGALAVGVGQQLQSLHGSVVDILASDLEVDLGTNVATLTGNVRVQIKGKYDATMTAPKVVATITQEKNQVISLEAQGPVTIDVITNTAEGKPWRVSARCSDSATFSEQTMTAVLRGNAHAEATGLPRLEGVESAKFDGDTMTVNLRKQIIKVTQAHLNAEMAPEGGSAGAGAQQ